MGNFGDWKSQETLIRAFKVIMSEHPDLQIKIRFVGSGEYLEPCKKLAADLGLLDNIEFLSEVGHEHLPDFYRSLDLFVLPSYFEGFGCVFTEAWSCGVPFITCEGQGMDDLIPADERKLWLVKPRDPEDLAAKIGHFIDCRPAQHLAGPVSFDALIPPFLEKIGI